jgi:hypothetical protein
LKGFKAPYNSLISFAFVKGVEEGKVLDGWGLKGELGDGCCAGGGGCNENKPKPLCHQPLFSQREWHGPQS